MTASDERHPESPQDDPRFQSVLVSCLESLERGESLDAARLRAEYPEFADELGEFLDDRQRLVEMASAIRDGGVVEVESLPTLIDSGTTDHEGDGTGRDGFVHTDLDSPTLDILEPTNKPGRIGELGSYEVIDVIGRGGMGVVLEAHDPHLNRVVAIKTLAPEFAANPTARKRFAREAQAAAAVSHAHVVTIHAVEPDGDLPYLVMEYVQGQSLAQKVDRVGALEVREILRIGAQTAQGLAAAHEQGLIHRDVKPGNVLLENGVERVKLTDFGLARATDDVAITRTGDISGTPQFMSPEQAEGRAVDVRSDLFSLGSVLYTMCTGRAPFRGDTAVAVLRKVCDAEPRAIRTVNADVPPWLVDIIEHLMAKDPEHRFQTAAEVARVLNEHLADLQNPSTGSKPSSGSKPKFERRLPKPRSRWRGWATLAALPILLGGIVAILQWNGFIDLRGPQPGEITIKLGDAVADTDTELYDNEGNRVAPHGSTLPPVYFHYTELDPGTYWIKVHALDDANDVVHWQAVEVSSGSVSAIHVDEPFETAVPQPPVSARLMEMREDTLAYNICNHGTKPIYSLWLRTPIHADAARKRFRMGWDWGRRGIAPGECRTETIKRWDAIPPFATTLATVVSYVDYGDGDAWDLIAEESSQDSGEAVPTGRLIVVADSAGPDDVVSVEYQGDGPKPAGTVPTSTAPAAGRPTFLLPAGNHMVRCSGRKAHGCWVRDGETTLVVMPETGEATIVERVDPVTAEWTRLGGRWVAVSGARKGSELDPAEAARIELRVDDESREITLDLGSSSEAVPAEIDPTPTPGHVNFLPTIKAIYERDGDELKLCIGGDRRPRPTAFHIDEKSGGGAQSFVFRRPGGPLTKNEDDLAITEVQRLKGQTDRTTGLWFLDDGRRALSSSGDGKLREWSVATGGIEQVLDDPRVGGAARLAVSPDERFAVTTDFRGGEHHIDVWNLVGGRVDHSFTVGGSPVFAIKFLPETEHFVVGTFNGELRTFDARTGMPVGEVVTIEKSHGFATTPYGRILVGSRQGSLHVVDMSRGEIVQTWRGHRGVVEDVTVSADGDWAAVGSIDGLISLWNARTGELLGELQGHKGPARIVFTPDGRHLVSGGWDRTIRLWSVREQRELTRVQTKNRVGLYLAVSPDGETVVSGGGTWWEAERKEWVSDGDFELRLWRLPEMVLPKKPLSDLTADSGALTKDRLTELVSAAAGISNPDWATIAGLTESPTFDTLENKSLSFLLFCLLFVPEDARGGPPPDFSENFEALTDGPPKPKDLAPAMWISKEKGYASLIQPEYVTDLSMNVAGDSAHGEIAFEKEGLYRGRVKFVARRANGEWRVEEFHVSSLKLAIERHEDGRWGPMTRAVPASHDERRRLERREKLKQIGIGLQNYLALRGHFPPWTGDGDPPEPPSNVPQDNANANAGSDDAESNVRSGRDKNAKPGLSCRVHLLPFVDEEELYDKFRFDEPWDSPHNAKLLAEMPDVYDTGHPTRTSLLAVVGKDRRLRSERR